MNASPAQHSTNRASKTTRWCAARGRFMRRPAPAEPGLCRLRALAARACAHRVGRHRGSRARRKGVLAVLTAADIKAAGIGSIGAPSAAAGPRRREDGRAVPPGAGRRARMHVGEAVAMVVAETLRAGAWTPPTWCQVEYEELPRGRRSRRGDEGRRTAIASPTRPAISAVDWPGLVPSEDNEREVDEIIKSAPHVARVTRRTSAHGGGLDGDARRHRRL